MRISNVFIFLWLQVIAILLFLDEYFLAIGFIAFSFIIIGLVVLFYPAKTKQKTISVFVLFTKILRRKMKKLVTAVITFLIFVTIISSYIGLNSIINTHYDHLLYSARFSSGDFQVSSNIFGIDKTSEIELFFMSVSDMIVTAFNESSFPGYIYRQDWFLFLRLEFSFYYEYRNITGEPIKGMTGLNGYLVVAEGSFWDYLLSILDIKNKTVPDFILFNHNLSLVEPPDLGFAKNISFLDPFSYSTGARYVFLNTTASNCSIISLGSYENTMTFKKEWDLPAVPGSIIVCPPTFFKQLFPEEDIIQPNNELIQIVAEWRGWINKSQGILHQFDYPFYYNQFKQFLLDEIGVNILGISSNFIGYYLSLTTTVSEFSNNFLIIEIPFFILGFLLFFFGYKELIIEEKNLKEWFKQRGIAFPSPFFFNSLKTSITFILGFSGGVIVSLLFLLFPLMLFGIPLQYLVVYFSQMPFIIAVSMETLIIFILIFYYYQLFTEDRFALEKRTIFSIEQLSWVDYSLIALLVTLYPLITSFLRLLNTSASDPKLNYILLGTLFSALSFFVVVVLRKLIQHVSRLAFLVFEKLKYVWNVGNKIYAYLASNASGIVILMLISLSFIHFSTSISFSSISYYSNVSGMYVGSDIRISGLDFHSAQLELLQNITSNDVQSYTVFQNLTIKDFRGNSNNNYNVQYHLIGINTSTFSQTAFFSEYFFGDEIRSLVRDLRENQSLICSSAQSFFNAKVGDTITLYLPVLMPLGSPYEEFTFSVVGAFTYWPGYNNLNYSDPVYKNENERNLIIVVSMETYNRIVSIAGVSSSTILMRVKSESKINYIVSNLRHALLRYYATLSIQGRYIPSDISDFRSIPELAFLLSFMSMIFLYSLVIFSISLFLLFRRYSKLLSPIISRLYGHGFTFREVLTVLLVDAILSSVIILVFTPLVALSYHYAYILILSRIFFEIHLSTKLSFDIVTIVTYFIIIFYHLFLCYYFANRVGKQKEIELPRVIV